MRLNRAHRQGTCDDATSVQDADVLGPMHCLQQATYHQVADAIPNDMRQGCMDPLIAPQTPDLVTHILTIFVVDHHPHLLWFADRTAPRHLVPRRPDVEQELNGRNKTAKVGEVIVLIFIVYLLLLVRTFNVPAPYRDTRLFVCDFQGLRVQCVLRPFELALQPLHFRPIPRVHPVPPWQPPSLQCRKLPVDLCGFVAFAACAIFDEGQLLDLVVCNCCRQGQWSVVSQ
mmetsp:Transcript_71836/g.181252  ORF Transcript_71836/g.181252 Transcript_71836/m.181252 type:complete len:229 (-) Transcript_71836:1328-2014(-)